MQPQSPNKDFDFMLKDQPQAARGPKLSHLHGRTKATLAVIAAVVLLIIIFSVLAGRRSGSAQPFISLVARGNEMLRVTGLVQQQLQLHDPQTQALAATAGSSLSSDKQQFIKYLAKNHTKLTPVQLALDKDKTTDTELQTAAQNNNLDIAYVNYLRNSLAVYQSDLKTAYKTSGANGKKLIQSAFDSAGALLSAAPLKS